MVYVPGETASNTYAPRSSVSVDLLMPVASRAIVTRTFGTGRDCGSVTMPDRVADATCPHAAEERKRIMHRVFMEYQREDERHLPVFGSASGRQARRSAV